MERVELYRKERSTLIELFNKKSEDEISRTRLFIPIQSLGAEIEKASYLGGLLQGNSYH